MPFAFTITAADAYNNPTPTYAGTVAFSSSDAAAALPGTSPLTNGTGTFSATLNTSGNQTITATDMGSASVTGTSGAVFVLGLAVTSFTPTADGFTATFSKPFDPAQLNLYDASGTYGPTDVTLVGQTFGPISGSLFLDPTDTKITFVKTVVAGTNGLPVGAGILPADTYTLTQTSTGCPQGNQSCDTVNVNTMPPSWYDLSNAIQTQASQPLEIPWCR